MKILAKHIGLGAAFTLVCAMSANAQNAETNQTTATTTGWGVQCNNTAEGLQCVANQSLLSSADNQRIISVSFQEAAEGANPTLIVQLPFGLNLPRGIDLSVDGAELGTFEVNTCLPAGCFVVQEAEQSLIDAMSAGQVLSVTMESSNGGETNMEMTLEGFSAALSRLQ